MSGNLSIFTIPTEPTPQVFLVVLSGVTYQMMLSYRDMTELDVLDFIIRTETSRLGIMTEAGDDLLTGYGDVTPLQSGGWVLDLALNDGTPLVSGIALVTGLNLLAPYPQLGIPGALMVIGTAQPDAAPTWTSLGTECNLYYGLLS